MALLDTPRLGRLLEPARPTYKREYLHWDELRRRTPPDDLTPEEWWLGFELARMTLRRALPLTDPSGAPFQFAMTDEILRMVHEIDRDASGRIELPEPVANREVRDRYVVNSLIEEAITSSQLEGASTTRAVAKDMLRSGRPPRDGSERMIRNNFSAMELIQARAKEPLSPTLVFDLHRVLTHDTLESAFADGAGRFRRADEPIRVVDSGDGEILHQPPPAASLARRMDAMCRFANATNDDVFIHPVARAILLHFWLAYDHPFVDGNGRTARALFYWSMLHQGYWLTELVSISRVIKKAPSRYARAFLYSETDSNDATYFLIEQLRVVRAAIDELHAYLTRKAAEVREVEQRLRAGSDLNHRQVALLTHSLRHPDATYTIESHRSSHQVVHQTARTDLLALTEKGLLQSRRIGRSYLFSPVKGLEKKLSSR